MTIHAISQEQVSVEHLAYYLPQFRRLVVYCTLCYNWLDHFEQHHLFSFHIKLLYHHQSSSPIANILLVNLFYRRRKIQTFTRLNLPYVIGIPSDCWIEGLSSLVKKDTA